MIAIIRFCAAAFQIPTQNPESTVSWACSASSASTSHSSSRVIRPSWFHLIWT
ncbi:hypothetical protein [Amycolatopsis vancoresmycina]|uniref:hypothetical protein n=1 Tax=Amycolatopsis vancoresmycina TaxID=208444 RepID=UPI00138ABD74|nr:hypothetical protein [Amycolatopsis vancoresmycina]